MYKRGFPGTVNFLSLSHYSSYPVFFPQLFLHLILIPQMNGISVYVLHVKLLFLYTQNKIFLAPSRTKFDPLQELFPLPMENMWPRIFFICALPLLDFRIRLYSTSQNETCNRPHFSRLRHNSQNSTEALRPTMQ